MKRKQATSTPAVAPGAVITGGEKTFTKRDKASFFFDKAKGPGMRRIWLILLVFVVLVGGALVLTSLLDRNKVVLEAGNHRYTKGEYDKLVSQAARIKVSESSARHALVQSLAARAAADELKIAYQDDDATLTTAARVKYDVPSTDAVSDFQKQAAYPLAIKQVATVADRGGYKAAIVFYPLSRYIVGSALVDGNKQEPEYDPKLLGDVSAIAADYAYAKQTAASDREAYIKKTKTIEQIISSVRGNARFTFGQAANDSRQVYVDDTGSTVELFGEGFSLDENLMKELKAAPTNGQPSELREQLVNMKAVPLNYPDIQRDGGYVGAIYFVVAEHYEARPGISGRHERLTKEYAQ